MRPAILAVCSLFAVSALQAREGIYQGNTETDVPLKDCLPAIEKGTFVREAEGREGKGRHSVFYYRGIFYFVSLTAKAIRCVSFEPED